MRLLMLLVVGITSGRAFSAAVVGQPICIAVLMWENVETALPYRQNLPSRNLTGS